MLFLFSIIINGLFFVTYIVLPWIRIQNLYVYHTAFSDIYVDEQYGGRIAHALQLTSALKRIEFINCGFYGCKFVTSILLNLFQNPNNERPPHIFYFIKK